MPIVPLTIANLSGGRNGVDSPIDPNFPDNQSVEAMNVDYSQGALGRRRGGADAVSTAGGTAFTGRINSQTRWLPAGDETLAQLFAVDNAAVPIMKRLSAGVWSDVTLSDPISANAQRISWAELNGKLFIAYDAGAGVNRLHCYDPDLAAPRVRRVGIAPGANGPTITNQGGGAYPATLRYYRIRFLRMSGTRIVSRSEPTPSTSFTPSGAGASARVTLPALPGEQETHWEIDASSNNVTWYKLLYAEAGTQIVIGTTTYDDAFFPTAYNTLNAADVSGQYTLPPACKYVVSDGANRLIMAGQFVSTLNGSRVYTTPVLGSADAGDDERFFQTATVKPFFDLNEKSGGDITGLSGAINGIVHAFKYRRTFRCTPTTNADVPYVPKQLSGSIGSIDHDGIVVAEDAAGNGAVYFMSHRGPYRIGVDGLKYHGRDIEDQWRGTNGKSKVNLDATTKVCHGRYYSELGQIWWWVATGASNTPNVLLVLDIKQATRSDQFGIRGGWSIYDGDIAAAISSTLFGDASGASYTRRLRPYIGLTGAATLLKCDTTSTNDNGTGFQAYLKTKSLVPANKLNRLFEVKESTLSAAVQADATIRQTLDGEFGRLQPTQDEVSLAPEGAETKVLKKFAASMISDAGVVQVQLGDPTIVSVGQWSLESLVLQVTELGDK